MIKTRRRFDDHRLSNLDKLMLKIQSVDQVLAELGVEIDDVQNSGRLIDYRS